MFSPKRLRKGDIRLLRLLRPATQQMNDPASQSEVNPIPRPKMKPQLGNSLSNRLNVTEIPVFNPVDLSANPASRDAVKIFQPLLDWNSIIFLVAPL